MSYVYTFLQSNILEWIVYLPLLALVRPSWSFIDRAMFITALNALTHPIVFFFIMNLKLPYLADIMIAETFAVVAEAVLICYFLRVNLTKSFFASLFANLVSWQIAPMLTYAVWSH